ncbi:MAG: hypothetical protein M1817_000756 [Caeruleum heppii]|nr:MAG: hypothetical protein M1817_000756 [Caeruleum heppii]
MARMLQRFTQVTPSIPIPIHKLLSITKCRPTRTSLGETRGWRPSTLRSPFLAAPILFSIILIVVLQYLSNNSARDGGVVFLDNIDDFPKSLTFCYDYLPTILTVSLGIIWSQVDLDAKRLEPYFQMSNPIGSLGCDSTLLDYTMDYAMFVPFKAAKHRHWSVFFASSCTIMVLWVITPLQSAIFSKETIIRHDIEAVSQPMGMLPFTKQWEALNTMFMLSAYGVCWLESSLPPYTTRDFALAPFEITSPKNVIGTAKTITAPTILYEASLNCQPGITKPDSDSYRAIFPGNCSLDARGPYKNSIRDYYADYVPSSLDVERDTYYDQCDTLAPRTNPAFWAKKVGDEEANITALLCERSYYTQEVNATISLPSKHVSSVFPLKPRQRLSEETFNISNFEYIISEGFPSGSNVYGRPEQMPLDHGSRLAKSNFEGLPDNMIGFLVGATQREPEEYLDPVIFQSALTETHKLLFAFAVNSLMRPLETDQSYPGTTSYESGAVVVVRTFAVLVQVALALFAVIATCLLVKSWNRTSCLSKDPASILDVMRHGRLNSEFFNLLRAFDASSNKRLAASLCHRRFALEDHKDYHESIPRLECLTPPSDTLIDMQDGPHDHPSARLLRPTTMSLVVGAPLLITLTTFLVSIGALYHQSKRVNGLARPSQNKLVQQILMRYLPTALVMVLEPVLLLLGRWLCILQPFMELKKGTSNTRKSVDAKYTTIAPQLVLWRALGAGHFILGAVCGVAFLSHVLAVALNGLFFERVVGIEKIEDVARRYHPLFDGTPDMTYRKLSPGISGYKDPFYVAKAHLLDGGVLPPWMSRDYFFVPFDLPIDAKNNQGKTYRAHTRAFGADLKCQQLNASETGDTVIIDDLYRREPNLTIHYASSGGTPKVCTPIIGPLLPLGDYSPSINETWAVEVFAPTAVGDTWSSPEEDASPENRAFCYKQLIAGYFRLNPTVASEAPPTPDLNVTMLSCERIMRTAPYEITVDGYGRVLHADQTGPSSTDLEPFVVGSTFNLTTELPSFLEGTGLWHDAIYTTDWMNLIMSKMKPDMDSLFDPDKPVPSFGVIEPVLRQVYKTVMAAALVLNLQFLIEAPSDDRIPCATLSPEPRIFLSTLVVIISITLLALIFIVVMAYYLFRPAKMMPRLPITIAAVLSYVCASKMLEEREAARTSSTSAVQEKTRHEEAYRYGWYRGIDDRWHIGIDRASRVRGLDDPPEKQESNAGSDGSAASAPSSQRSAHSSDEREELRPPGPGWI